MAKKYRVLRGLSWYGGGRAEPGEIRDDLPPKAIPEWLKERNPGAGDSDIELVTEESGTTEGEHGVPVG